MPTQPAEPTLVRVATADKKDVEELAARLTAEGTEHGPISSVEPTPDLAMDFGPIISHIHEIIVFVEAFVISGTIAKWLMERAEREEAKRAAEAAKAAAPPPPTQPAVYVSVHVGNNIIVVDQRSTPQSVRRDIEEIDRNRR